MSESDYRDMEEFIREHPVNCPDCGEFLLLCCKEWPHVIECPECGWPAPEPEYVVDAATGATT